MFPLPPEASLLTDTRRLPATAPGGLSLVMLLLLLPPLHGQCTALLHIAAAVAAPSPGSWHLGPSSHSVCGVCRQLLESHHHTPCSNAHNPIPGAHGWLYSTGDTAASMQIEVPGFILEEMACILTALNLFKSRHTIMPAGRSILNGPQKQLRSGVMGDNRQLLVASTGQPIVLTHMQSRAYKSAAHAPVSVGSNLVLCGTNHMSGGVSLLLGQACEPLSSPLCLRCEHVLCRGIESVPAVIPGARHIV